MKIILSRKGFDKGSGGYPSPYLKDEGKLLSLPIPNSQSYFSYKDLNFNDKLSYYDLMCKCQYKNDQKVENNYVQKVA